MRQTRGWVNRWSVSDRCSLFLTLITQDIYSLLLITMPSWTAFSHWRLFQHTLPTHGPSTTLTHKPSRPTYLPLHTSCQATILILTHNFHSTPTYLYTQFSWPTYLPLDTIFTAYLLISLHTILPVYLPLHTIFTVPLLTLYTIFTAHLSKLIQNCHYCA